MSYAFRRMHSGGKCLDMLASYRCLSTLTYFIEAHLRYICLMDALSHRADALLSLLETLDADILEKIKLNISKL